MSATKYYNTAITGSRTTIRSRTDEGIPDKTFSGGQCLMVREFDENTIASGSWTELWVGVRWAIRMDVPMNNSLGGATGLGNENVWPNSYERMGIGICDTSGFVAGELSQSNILQPLVGGNMGGIPATHNSHSLYIHMGYQPVDWDLYRYSGSSPARYDTSMTYSYTHTSAQAIVNVTGSKMGFPNAAQVVRMPVQNFPSSSGRNFFILRFATSSGDPHTWQVHSVFPNSTAEYINDYSGTFRLVDLMKFNDWADFVGYATWMGYTTYDHGEQKVDQKANGFFDGVFFYWKRYWDTLEMSDIIVRAITSSTEVSW